MTVLTTSEVIYFFVNRVGTFNFWGAGYGSFVFKKKEKRQQKRFSES